MAISPVAVTLGVDSREGSPEVISLEVISRAATRNRNLAVDQDKSREEDLRAKGGSRSKRASLKSLTFVGLFLFATPTVRARSQAYEKTRSRADLAEDQEQSVNESPARAPEFRNVKRTECAAHVRIGSERRGSR